MSLIVIMKGYIFNADKVWREWKVYEQAEKTETILDAKFSL